MKYSAILIYIILPFLIQAQNSAFFETMFWFKDAAGNLDSIVVGHDIDANSFYNPQFDEANINDPWDSVFEVRAAHFNDWNIMNPNLILSKKIIAGNEQGYDPIYNCLWINEGIIFFIRVVNLPITIYWNRDAFENNFCRNRSTLTPNMFPYIIPDWYVDLEEDVDYVCLAERDSFIVSTFNDAFSFFLIDSVEGETIDTIAALLFHSDYQNVDSPCTSTVSVNHLHQPENPILYPNPTSDFINIPDDDHLSWSVFDPIGHNNIHGKGSKIDLSSIEQGLYFINIINDNGILIYSGKIVKL